MVVPGLAIVFGTGRREGYHTALHFDEGADVSQEDRKREAALAASALVTDGMIVGLGTGSTAKHLVSILGERVRQGLNIIAIPTSEATRIQALGEGITVVGFSEQHQIGRAPV